MAIKRVLAAPRVSRSSLGKKGRAIVLVVVVVVVVVMIIVVGVVFV
jgi:hypothetical protein